MSVITAPTTAEYAAVIAANGLPKPAAEIVYPDSDGKPMAENTIQFRWLTRITEGLEARFRRDPLVFVAGDLLWYPVKDHPKINTAPDVLVAVGRPKGDRNSYKQWEEADIAPQVVVEIWSPSNTRQKKDAKLVWYELYGVEEYYTFDPDAEEMKGWLRRRDRLRPIAALNGWESPCLGVKFRRVSGEWNLYHPHGAPFEDYLAVYNDREAERAAKEIERAAKEAERAAKEIERAAKEIERAAKEAAFAKLRALGIDPESLSPH